MANEGRLRAQVLFLHDAGRRDGEREQVEAEDHGKEGAKNGDLRGCGHGRWELPVSHLFGPHQAQPGLVGQTGMQNWVI